MKIQQIANEFTWKFRTQTPEQQLALMNPLSKTIDRLKSYAQALEKQRLTYEDKLKSIAEEISAAREYSMVDSLVRERVEDLTRQQKAVIRQREWISKRKTNLNETSKQLQTLLIPDAEREDSHELFKQLRQRGLSTSFDRSRAYRLFSHGSNHPS